MPNAKPYVAVACVCEKVLTEADGVASIIRIVDTFFLQLPEVPTPAGVTTVVGLTAFVSIKSGDVTGPHELGLVMRQPNGKQGETRKWPVVLNGGEHGANLRVEFVLAGTEGKPPELGLYWFDVLWKDEVLTSIPFRLKRAEPTAAAGSPSTP